MIHFLAELANFLQERLEIGVVFSEPEHAHQRVFPRYLNGQKQSRVESLAQQPTNLFHSQEDDGYIADIPDLRYCSAFGRTPAEALSAQRNRPSETLGENAAAFSPSAIKLPVGYQQFVLTGAPLGG